jgi:hypothetical protein
MRDSFHCESQQRALAITRSPPNYHTKENEKFVSKKAKVNFYLKNKKVKMSAMHTEAHEISPPIQLQQ